LPLGLDTTPLIVRLVLAATPMVTFDPLGDGLPRTTGPAQVLFPLVLASAPAVLAPAGPFPLSVRNSSRMVNPTPAGSAIRSWPNLVSVWLTTVPLATVPAPPVDDVPRAGAPPAVRIPALTVGGA